MSTPLTALVADREIEYLDVEDLIELARMLLGDPPPIRDFGLLGSAAARPQATAFGEDALLDSLVKNHALVDGNKRLGWLATAVFLEINGVAISKASNDAVYELVLEVAAGDRRVDEIAAGLRRLIRQR